MSPLSEAFQAGFDSESWDRPQAANPYPDGSQESKRWFWGRFASRRIKRGYGQFGGELPRPYRWSKLSGVPDTKEAW